MNIINLTKIFLNHILTFIPGNIDKELFLDYISGLILQDKYFSVNGISKYAKNKSKWQLYGLLDKKINWTKIFYDLGRLMTSILFTKWFLIADGTPIIQKYAKNRITKRGLISIKGKKNIPQNEMISLALTNGIIYIPLDFVIWVSDKVIKLSEYRKKTDILFGMIHKYNLMKIPVKTIMFDSFFTSKKMMNWLIRNGYTFFTRLKKNRVIFVNGEKYKLENFSLDYGESIVCKLQGIKGAVKILRIQYQDEDVFVASNNTSLTNQELEYQYKQRWKIEEFHREVKQRLGLEYIFVRSWQKLNNHVGFTCLAYSILSIIRFQSNSSISNSKYLIKDSILNISTAVDKMVNILIT